MDYKLIQYRVKADRIAENEQLVRAVFTELRERRVTGVHYTVLRQEDGTFTHLVAADAGGTTAPLTSLPSFQRFQADVKARCAVLPSVNPVQVLGNHGMLDGQG
jgi:hypothetical protein